MWFLGEHEICIFIIAITIDCYWFDYWIYKYIIAIAITIQEILFVGCFLCFLFLLIFMKFSTFRMMTPIMMMMPRNRSQRMPRRTSRIRLCGNLWFPASMLILTSMRRRRRMTRRTSRMTKAFKYGWSRLSIYLNINIYVYSMLYLYFWFICIYGFLLLLLLLLLSLWISL